MAFVKLLNLIYLSGVAAFALNIVSSVLFGRQRLVRRLKYIAKGLFFTCVWPLAIFSKEGRQILISRSTNL